MPRVSVVLVTALMCACVSSARLCANTTDSDTPASTDSDTPKPQPKISKSRERVTTRRPGRKLSKAQQEKEHADWLARVKANGVEVWPDDESEKEHAEALAK